MPSPSGSSLPSAWPSPFESAWTGEDPTRSSSTFGTPSPSLSSSPSARPSSLESPLPGCEPSAYSTVLSRPSPSVSWRASPGSLGSSPSWRSQVSGRPSRSTSAAIARGAFSKLPVGPWPRPRVAVCSVGPPAGAPPPPAGDGVIAGPPGRPGRPKVPPPATAVAAAPPSGDAALPGRTGARCCGASDRRTVPGPERSSFVGQSVHFSDGAARTPAATMPATRPADTGAAIRRSRVGRRSRSGPDRLDVSCPFWSTNTSTFRVGRIESGDERDLSLTGRTFDPDRRGFERERAT